MYRWQSWDVGALFVLGPNVACSSACGYEEAPPPAKITHLARSPHHGSPSPMLPLILPTLNLRKHEKVAYIPRWRGEARWQLQARTGGLQRCGYVKDGEVVTHTVVKPQFGPAWAFTVGSTTATRVMNEEQDWMMWLYQCHIRDGWNLSHIYFT
jgi:hypothetical protein